MRHHRIKKKKGHWSLLEQDLRGPCLPSVNPLAAGLWRFGRGWGWGSEMKEVSSRGF